MNSPDDDFRGEPASAPLALCLFAAFAFLFALLGRGTLYAPEESDIFNASVSLAKDNHLVRTHREILPILASVPEALAGIIVQARMKSEGPPVVPQAALLNQAAGAGGTNWPMFLTMLILGPVACAGVMVLVFLAAQRSGASTASALLLTLAVGWCTPMVFYARTIFPQIFEALFLMLGFYRAEQYRRHQDLSSVANLAFACALGILSRSFFAVTAGWFLLYVALVTQGDNRDRLRALLALLVPIGAALGVVALVNWLRWGNPLDLGYRDAHFDGSIADGALGLLFSPGKGLFCFAPILLAVLWKLPAILARGWQEVVLLTGITASYVLAFSAWHDWQGGVSWGPRFLLPILAPWISLLSRATNEDGDFGAFGIVLGLLAALGFALQIPGWTQAPLLMDLLQCDAWSTTKNHVAVMANHLLQHGPTDLWIWTGKTTSPLHQDFLVALGIGFGASWLAAVALFDSGRAQLLWCAPLAIFAGLVAVGFIF